MQKGITTVVPQMWTAQLSFVTAALELCELVGNNQRKQKSVLLSFVKIQSQNFLQGLAHQAFFKKHISWSGSDLDRWGCITDPWVLDAHVWKRRILFIIWMNNTNIYKNKITHTKHTEGLRELYVSTKQEIYNGIFSTLHFKRKWHFSFSLR